MPPPRIQPAPIDPPSRSICRHGLLRILTLVLACSLGNLALPSLPGQTAERDWLTEIRTIAKDAGSPLEAYDRINQLAPARLDDPAVALELVEIRVELLSELARADEAVRQLDLFQQRFPSAAQEFTARIQALEDTVASIHMEQQIADLSEESELQELRLLRKEAAIERLETENTASKIIQITVAVLFGLSIFAGIILYSRYQIKKQSESELRELNRELQNERDRVTAQAATIAKQNQELLRNNEVMKEFHSQLSEMVGMAVHDLKNPIGVQRSYISLLKEELEDPALQAAAERSGLLETLELMQSTGDHMLDIVTRMLRHQEVDYAESKPERVDLTNTALEVLMRNELNATKKQIFLDTDFEDSVYAMVDPHYTVEILENLVSNAIKYSPAGKSVTVKVDHQGNRARTLVIDEGPGLSDDDMAKLFNRFQKLSAKPTGEESSTGLGLSIVKRLVEVQNGRVYAENNETGGARFVVEFPLA